MGGYGWRDALLSYRLVSLFAGLTTMMVMAVSLKYLYREKAERLLVFLGVMSCGVVLLFFGYVENYALFNTIIISFCFLGMLAVDKKISRLWPILIAVISIAFHYFGVVFLPAAIYLLFRGTALGNKLKDSIGLRIALAAVALVSLIISVVYFYEKSYAIRFALVPFVNDRFTINGYTLLSVSHILDYLNLIFRLIPGLLIGLIGILILRPGIKGMHPRAVFLSMTSAVSLGFVFFIDPKLGMARDWDLMGFAGFPLSILIIDLLLRNNKHVANGRLALKYIILIGTFILISRAGTLIDPRAALQLLANDMRQDWIKYSAIGDPLKQYVEWGGDSRVVDSVIKEHRQRFKDSPSSKALKYFNDNDYENAARLFEEDIRYNPQRAFPYGYLAMCQEQFGRYDSAIALLDIAYGLDNYNLGIIVELGSCYAIKGDNSKAINYFQKALSLEKDHIPALVKLTALFMIQGDLEKSQEYYRRLLNRNDVSPLYFYAIGNDFESHGYKSLALRSFNEAIKRRLPDIYLDELKTKYPSLFQ
ncbi:MAG: tetratricopeptide repeat protein [Candidatus Zixiibacteriota bacterium]|nr:MAG: tetratricopeptide repeat protein [candidate division Zixibacteria bacterium]